MKYPGRVIKQGESNKLVVKAIQQRLNELGLGAFELSGEFGPKTKAAVKQFQATHRDHNGQPLEIDGKVGSITWESLFDQEPPFLGELPPNDFLKKALEIARSQIGVMEKPPGSNRGPEVDAYLDLVNCPRGSYWCAAFTYWCMEKAATELNRANPVHKTAGCINHWNKTKGRKIIAAAAVNNPELINPGQIFIIDHGAGMGHTGMVEKVEGGFIHTIEGNSNNNGSRNGLGVFRVQRKIGKINRGFIEYA